MKKQIFKNFTLRLKPLEANKGQSKEAWLSQLAQITELNL